MVGAEAFEKSAIFVVRSLVGAAPPTQFAFWLQEALLVPAHEMAVWAVPDGTNEHPSAAAIIRVSGRRSEANVVMMVF